MKIAVIGCGSMGCYFGAKLSLKNEVIYIDTFQKTIDTLNKEGITIKEGDEITNYQAPAFMTGKYTDPVDLVLLFVKSTQNQAALQENQALFNEHTIVVSLQNGFGNEREISKYVDMDNIIIGNTLINCVSDDIGKIKRTGDGLTVLGSLVDNKKVAITCRVLFAQSGFKAEVSNDIKKIVWENMFISATLNPLTAIFKCKTKVAYENKYIWQLVEMMAAEAVKVAAADGCEFDIEKVLLSIKNTCVNVGKGYTSMYQDIKNKRFTEIEKMNGQIANLAYKYRIDAPYNEFALNSVKAIERLY